MHTTVNSNNDEFKRFYDNFKNERTKESDNYKLIRSRSERLDQLFNEVDATFQLFDKRIQSGKTYCIVFDSKTYYEFTSALIKEHIKEKLDSNKEYYVKGTTKSTTVQNRTDQASKIIVSNTNWPALERIRLTLSPKNYTKFMKSCRTNAYFIDSIILKIDPLTSVDEEMKLLEEHIKPMGLKPFIVFNDLSEKEFTQDESGLYSRTLYAMKDFDFISSDRIFTGFSRRSYYSNIMQINENFEKLKKAIEDDLTMDNVYGRFWSKVQLMMESIKEIEKTFAEDRSNMIDDLTHSENKLKLEKDKMVSTIQKSQRHMESKLEEKIKEVMPTENKISLNIKVLRNNIEPVIDSNYDNFRMQFNEQIMNTIKTNNINFDKYVSNIYFNDYMKKSDYEDKSKDDIDKCLQKIQSELENDAMKVRDSQSIIGKVVSSVKNCVQDKFSTIKGSFDRYVIELKDKVVRKYDETRKSVTAFTDTIINKLPQHYSHNDVRNSIKLIINKSKVQMLTKIHDAIKSILDEIRSMGNIHVPVTKHIDLHEVKFTDKLTDYRKVSERLSSSIKYQQQQLNNEIRKTWPERLSQYNTEYHFCHFFKFVDCSLKNLYKELSKKKNFSITVHNNAYAGAATRATSIYDTAVNTYNYGWLSGAPLNTAIVSIKYDLIEQKATTFGTHIIEELDFILEDLLNEIFRYVT